MQHVSLCLCSLLAATSQFSIPIGQKMQLTGWENANNVRNAICAASKISKVPMQDALLFISYSMTEDYLKRKTIEKLFCWLAAMFLASNCTCAGYFTYTAHVQLLAKNMAATHVHAICIRNQTNTLRFCREDNPLYVFILWLRPARRIHYVLPLVLQDESTTSCPWSCNTKYTYRYMRHRLLTHT